MKKKRLQGQEETLRQFVSKVYHQVADQFKDLVRKRFPLRAYGQDKKSETYKKSYPNSFKKYFFSVVKSFVKTNRGQYKRVRNAPPIYKIIYGKKKCHVHAFGCPEGCTFVTYNKRVLLRYKFKQKKYVEYYELLKLLQLLLRTTVMKKKERDPQPFRSRVWRRRDFKDALRKVYMLDSEMQNCTFEPEAGSMNKNLEMVKRANPNLNQPDPEAFFNKLGKNFEKSHPEVYKAGVVKRSKLKFMNGKYEEAMNFILYV